MTTKKTLYIHIGMPKTGSTTIQHGLFQNENALRAAGYYLPVTSRHPSDVTIVHANIAREFRTHRPLMHALFVPSEPMADVITEIQGQHTPHAIISIELLYDLLPEAIEHFRATIPASIQPVIIVYLRRREHYLQSSWSQRVKASRYTKPFDEFVAIQLEKRHDDYDYDLILGRWEAVFGIEHMRVHKFDDVLASGEELFHHFLATCDVQHPQQFTVPARVNESPSYRTLEVVRQVTQETGINFYTPGRFIASDHFAQPILDHANRAGWNTTKPNLLTRAQVEQIRDSYADGDARVAQRYFNSDVLFPDEFTEQPPSQFDITRDVSHTDLVSMLAGALVHNYNSQQQLAEEQQRRIELHEQLAQAHRKNVALAAELRERHNMPLARVSELLAAAQQEIRTAGVSGVLQRAVQWLRGQRRSIDT